MLTHRILFFLLLGASLHAQAQDTLVWQGDVASTNGFVADIAELYNRTENGDVQLSLATASSAVAAVANGEADIAGITRPTRARDRAERRAAMYPIAWDALVVVTHPGNPIRNINLLQFKALYKGEINNWSQLGGADTPIRLFRHSGAYQGIDYNVRQLMWGNPEEELVTTDTAPNAVELIKAISNNTDAIGVTTYSLAIREDLNILMFDGFAANLSNIRAGDYKLYIPIYAAVLERNPKRREIREFIRFFSSSSAQRILKRAGVLPYSDGLSLVAQQLERDEELQRVSAP